MFVLDLCDLSICKQVRCKMLKCIRPHTADSTSPNEESVLYAVCHGKKLPHLSRMFAGNTEGTGSRNGLPDVHYLGAQLRPHPATGEVLPCNPSTVFPSHCKTDTMFSVFFCLFWLLCFFCVLFFFYVKGSNPHQHICLSLNSSHGKLKNKTQCRQELFRLLANFQSQRCRW